MWRNRNSCAFLVGMQNHVAAMENSIVFPQKIIYRIMHTIRSSNSIFGYTYIPQKLKTKTYTDI